MPMFRLVSVDGRPALEQPVPILAVALEALRCRVGVFAV